MLFSSCDFGLSSKLNSCFGNGGGKNGCILHYVENDKVLKDGDLVLIDAACEYQLYASDITRTFPVNGKFSTKKKETENSLFSILNY